MKKVLFASAFAAALIAAGDGIESSNIVGYHTKENVAQNTFYILGGQFEAIGGGRPIQSIFAPISGVNYDEANAFLTTASQIQIPNAIGYDTYYYLNDGWFDDNGADGFKAGWCDNFGVLVDAEIDDGVAFWFKNKVDATSSFTQDGQVPSDASIAVDCPADFKLRSNPFPVAFKLNGDKVAFSSQMVPVSYDDENVFLTTAPQIQVPNGVGYDTYYYLSDGWFDDNGADGFKAGWCDNFGVLVDAEVPAGQGFWTKGVNGTFTLTFSL